MPRYTEEQIEQVRSANDIVGCDRRVSTIEAFRQRVCRAMSVS